jgi:hypothetical protein
MKRMWAARISVVVLVACASAIEACGSRTDVLGGVIALNDAAVDARIDAARDAGRDAARDADADALPPLDAPPVADVDRRDCPTAEATLIYLVTDANRLLSFYPPTRQFKEIGGLSCPAGGATPFSMAIDRKGVAYVLFSDGNLFRVSTKTAACIPTAFAVNQQRFLTFGMGFASDNGGPQETLYVAGESRNGGATGLAKISIPALGLSRVGEFVPDIQRAELTGTGDGRLFAFYAKSEGSGTWIGAINTRTAAVTSESPLPTVDLGNAWAFAAWGGDFYTFTAVDGVTAVDRFQVTTSQVTPWAKLPSGRVVGAGVSTCAPTE